MPRPRARGPSPSERPLSTTIGRTFTILLASLAVTGQVVYLRALAWTGAGLGSASGTARPTVVGVVGAGAVVSAMAALSAVVVHLRAPRERGARGLAVALAAWGYLLAYPGVRMLLAPAGAAARWVFDAHFLAIEACGLAGLLAFSARFPRQLEPSDLQSPVTLPPGVGLAQRGRALLLRPHAPWLAGALAVAGVVAVNGALARPAADAALLPLTDVLRLAALALVVLNLRRGYILADADERARGQWVALGFVLLLASAGLVVGSNVLSAVTGWETERVNWRPMLLDAGVLGLIWGTSRGVLHDGASRAAPLVPRVGLAAVSLTAALLLAAGLEAFFSGALPGRLFLPRGLGTAIGVLTVGTLYVGLRPTGEAALLRSWRSAGAPDTGP